jgi:putative transcriptional regulator
VSHLAPGFLVAAPPLGDPNFDRSVVLLASHGPDGAFGWIINGREVMSLSELLRRSEITDERIPITGNVRVGGPVSPEQVWLVYKSEDRRPNIEGQFEVASGIVASASRKVLESVAETRVTGSMIGLIGYAGWAPSQLEEEIRLGAWLPTDVEAGVVFDVAREQIWQRAYERIGASPIAFTGRTVGSA